MEELRRNLLKRDLGERAVDKRIAAMRESFPDAEVTGYENLIDDMECDPKDRHVLAATVRGDATTLVTFNLKDFPKESLERYDIEAVHPDAFLLDLLDLYPGIVLHTVQATAASYENPPMTASDLLELLDLSGVPKFVAAVRAML
jgi:hypothetical protein